MNKGRIVQVMGPVVDVVFENGDLPFIKDALEVDNSRRLSESRQAMKVRYSSRKS